MDAGNACEARQQSHYAGGTTLFQAVRAEQLRIRRLLAEASDPLPWSATSRMRRRRQLRAGRCHPWVRCQTVPS
jgi:hypothetical protein